MANHGYCKNCWWHDGIYCYMWRHITKDDSYCPDYINRSNCKETLDDWIKRMGVEKLPL